MLEFVNGLVPAASGTIAIVAGYMGAPLLSRVLEVRRLERACRRLRAVVLTYDDGPSSELTPAILELLAGYEARATFFVLGSRVAGREQVLDRVVAAGHEIGCHGQSHYNAWKSMPWTALRDIEAGFDTLSRWVGKRSVFRPPHGKLTLITWLVLASRRIPIGWWTVDSGDTHPELPDPQEVTDRIVRESGGVVLLHDFDRDRGRDRMDYVLGTTRKLLEASRREGLQILRLGDLSIDPAHPA